MKRKEKTTETSAISKTSALDKRPAFDKKLSASAIFVFLSCIICFFIAGCGEGFQEIPEGTLNGPCLPGDQCEESLICVDGICVSDDCIPDCDERECGPDGCEGFCPPGCPSHQTCTDSGWCADLICNPDCTNRECGPDGCGGLCPPGCSQGQACDASGQCTDEDCTPDCAGRECGPDGCGGSCPPGCSQGQTCDASGQCTDEDCTPDCAGRECGPDGCGGSCPPGCSQGQTCDASGQCSDPVCVPNCTNRECGPDGCGGSCPPGCGTNELCSTSGECYIDPASLPVFETHFNIPPEGGTDEHLESVIINLLQMSPPGSSVRAAFYTWSRTGVANAFVNAYNSGVDVRVIVGNTNRHNDGTDWQAIQILRNGLGNRLTICREGQSSGGCIGDGIQHNKFTLFSNLDDGSSNVVFQSSANHTNPQRQQFNNAIIIRGDTSLYNAYSDYWHDMLSQQQNLNYYRSFLGDYNTKVYFFPRASGDTIVNILNNITCDANSHIHVAMAYFSNPRIAIAQTLAQRHAEGCNVKVLVRHDSTGANIISTLNIPGIDLAVFPSGYAHGVHSKYLLINAPYGSTATRQKLVWTGSHNYTGPALRNHDETLLKIENDDVYDAYLANWNIMRSRL